MGLIYKPSDSQGLVRALNRNIRTADEMIVGLNQASKHLVAALNNKTLSGAAYTAGKGMFSQLVLPAISRASRSLDKLKSEAKQYEGFSADAGGELLDEDKLNEQLQILQTQQATLISQINFYKQQAFSHSDNSDLKLSYIDASQQLSAYINTVSDDIQKVQDKLRKLHAFNTNVMPLFKDVTQDFKVVADAVSVITTTTFTKNGKFSISKAKTAYKLVEVGTNYKNARRFLSGTKIIKTVNTDGDTVLKVGKKYLSKVGKGHIYKTGKTFEALSKLKLGDYKQFSQVFKSEFKSGVKVIENFKAWKGASKFTKLGKGLGILGTGATIFHNASNDFKGGVNGGSVKKFAVDTAVDLSAGAGATALGASVGSLILPPLGTVVGVGVGITINVIINSKFSFLGNKTIVEQFKTRTKAITKHISDGASEITNDIGKSLSRIFW